MAKKRTFFTANLMQTIALGTLCAMGAFAVGIETAGDVHPFSRSMAALQDVTSTGTSIAGDVNGNGKLDTDDAYILFQAAQGLETPTADQIRRGDTDGDFQLTNKDVNKVLRALSHQ